MSRTLIALLLPLFAIAANLSGATSTTGSLRGTVRDSSGAPLRDVLVMLSSERLPGGRSTRTDSDGTYRFALLPPGDDFALVFERKGFERVLHREIVVPLGSEVQFDIDVRPTLAAEVVVRASAPLVDLSNATVSTNITSEQFEILPTRRDFQQLTTLAPGVHMDTRSPLSPTVSGATHLENDYIIEGLSTRDVMVGASATNLTMNFVDEVQVITANASARFGRATGGIINVITKAGSNEFAGDVAAYYEDADWASAAVATEFRGTTSTDLGHDKKDLAVSLGGPIIRDRVWFFAAADPRRDVTPLHLQSAAFGIDRRERIVFSEDVYAAKISAAAGSHNMTISGFGNPTLRGGWLGRPHSDATAALWSDYGGTRNVSLRYDGAIARRTWIEATAGQHRKQRKSRPDTEIGRTVPWQLNAISGYTYGGLQHEGRDASRRDFFSAGGSHSMRRHNLRFGAEVERNRFDDSYREVTYVFFGEFVVDPTIGSRPVMHERAFDDSGYGTNRITTAFIEDQYRVLDNLVLTAGLRWEQQVVSSGRGVTIVEGLGADGSMIGRPAADFEFGDNWAPRLGVVWDPAGRGRAKIYAAGGRFFEAIPVSVNVGFFNGFAFAARYFYSAVGHTADTWFNRTGSPLNDQWVMYGRLDLDVPPRAGGIDPRAKVQFQDEYSLGSQVQIGAATTIGLHLVQRSIGRVLEDRAAWNPNNLRQTPGEYFLLNVGEGIYGSMYRRPQRRYRALELTLHRRLRERWQVLGSFVTSEERGDYDGLYEYSSSAASPNTGFSFDIPRFQDNAFGKLRGDRPYQAKLHSSYALPFDIKVSESLTYSAGVPISALVGPALTGGKRVVYLTERGSEGRTPDFWSLDLHAEWRMPFLARHDVSTALVADVFNATNNHEVLEVDELYIYPGSPGIGQWRAPSNLDQWGLPRFNPDLPHSVYFKTPTRYQAPRALQLGVRLKF